MAVGKLWSVTLDCADPTPLAQFWASMLDGTVAFESDAFIAVQTPGDTWIAAYKIEDYVAPKWPDGDVAKQFHLDLAVDDLDVAEREAIALGAVKAEHQPNADTFRVLFDPAGHPFCVTTATA